MQISSVRQCGAIMVVVFCDDYDNGDVIHFR